MKKYLGAVLFVSATLHGSTAQQEHLPLANLDAAPDYYARIAWQLDQQQELDKSGMKWLALASSNDCQMSADLSVAGERFLQEGQGAYSTKTFPQGLRWVITNQTNGIGLMDSRAHYMIGPKNSLDRCTIDTLQATYAAVITELKTGWEQINIEHRSVTTSDKEPDRASNGSAKLFTKQTVINGLEASLLQNLVNKFGLNKGVTCYVVNNHTICLSIAPKALKTFHKMLWDTGIIIQDTECIKRTESKWDKKSVLFGIPLSSLLSN